MYAVIFRSIRTADFEQLYEEHSERMEALVKSSKGYITHFSQRDPETREGITVSYFESLESIKEWREHPEHRVSQEFGRTHFYSWYQFEVVKVERKYDWKLK